MRKIVKPAILLALILAVVGISVAWSAPAEAKSTGATIAEEAKQLTGTPYRYGGASPSNGFDSSGLVYYLHKKQGITIPRTVKGQADGGRSVSVSQLAPGDVLIFKDKGNSPEISALYIGNGQAVTSLPSTKGVKVQSVETNWAKQHFLKAKRYVGQSDKSAGTQPKRTSSPNSSPGSSPNSSKADAIIKTGEKYLGTPYRFGAKAGSGYFDCSSFTQAVFAENGIKLPRSSRQQATVGTYVKWGEWEKGDLLFFWTRATGKGKVGHVAIYAGNNRILHTWGKPGVTYDKITDRAWKETYMGARRVLQ